MFQRVEQVRDEVIGVRPVYTDTGNGTELLLASGGAGVDRRGSKAVVNALARCYAVDLQAQHRLVREKLGKKSVLPFYLPGPRVFIPLKMREALNGNDSAYGYLDVNYLGSFQEEENKSCQVLLPGGRKVRVLSGKSTVVQSRHLGQELLASLKGGPEADLRESQVEEMIRLVIRVLHRWVSVDGQFKGLNPVNLTI